MKIATNELEHLREEVKNCHRIIKDLQKKREFVGLTDDEIEMIVENKRAAHWEFVRQVEAKLKEKNNEKGG
jgi:hypothetical protein